MIDQEESKDPKVTLADKKSPLDSVDQMQNQIPAAMQGSVKIEGKHGKCANHDKQKVVKGQNQQEQKNLAQ